MHVLHECVFIHGVPRMCMQVCNVHVHMQVHSDCVPLKNSCIIRPSRLSPVVQGLAWLLTPLPKHLCLQVLMNTALLTPQQLAEYYVQAW